MRKVLTFLAIIAMIIGYQPVYSKNPGESSTKTQLEIMMSDYLNNNNNLPAKYHARIPTKAKQVKGKQNVMVGLFQFPDFKPTIIPESVMESFTNKNYKSLTDYYSRASNGETIIEYGSAGIKGWMMMPKPISKYSSFDELLDDANELFKKNGYDFSEYDIDGNGWPDLIIYIWAGSIYNLGRIIPGGFTMFMEKGNIISQLESLRSESGFNLEVIIHEFFHGFFECYDLYDYSGRDTNVGGWDIMGEGWVAGYTGLCAYSRWKAGWVDVETITDPGVYEINDLNSDNPHRLYKIPIPGTENEWILLENRQRHGIDGYYQGCPGNGIVAYHIYDAREYGGRSNTRTKENPFVGVYTLDTGGSGNLKQQAMLGKNYGRTKLTGNTTPNTLPYYPTFGSKTISITDVSEVGPKMTFKLSYDEPQTPMVVVSEVLDFGKVEKGKTSTIKLNFRNAGKGKLRLMLKALDLWISLDRSSFIGIDEDIFVTVDATKLDFGIHNGKITYGGENLDKNGYVKVVVKVTPKLGDMNADGTVDSIDFDLFQKAFGSEADDPNFDERADLNEDFSVDINDFFIMARNFDKNKK